MADPFVLSASSVATFLRCGTQWRLLYIDGVRGLPSLKAARGIAVHRGVEVNMRQKITSQVDLPVQDVLDAYDTAWTDEIADGYGKDEDQDEGDIKDAGYKMLSIYHRQVAPQIQPAIVEEPIQFKVNGQPFSGQIDLGQYVPTKLWGDPEMRLEIRDTKTTARAPKPEGYLLNMTGYAIGMRQATGQIEADTVFDYLVATKQPYHREIRFGAPVTDAEIRAFSRIVGSVADSIKAGRFVPNGIGNGACSWCGVRAMCPAYIRRDPLT